MSQKPYKFQAFVTAIPQQGGTAAGSAVRAETALPPGQIRRMAVRGEHHETHDTHLFSALVANSGDSAEGIGDNDAVVTVTLSADD